MLPQKLCFVDLETTGGSSARDRVIEIGMLRVEDGIVTKEYQSLINPEKYIPPEIERLTGITGQDVINAPLFYEIKDRILETLDGCHLVAHNVRFDYGFLKSEFARLHMPFSPKHFCTVKLSRLLYPTETHHNLDAVMARCNITCEKRHRAFDDAKVLHEFFQHSLKRFPLTIVEQALNLAMKKPSLPTKLNQIDLDKLPESPGVYIFYGQAIPETEQLPLEKNNAPLEIPAEKSLPLSKTPLVPLYIGKSINLRERVLSHFAADIRNSTEMKISQQIEHIETIQTAGELGALFTESALIKKMLPLYNKMLRRKKELIAIKHTVDSQGYETTFLEPIDTVNPKTLSTFLGFFRSRRQAKEYLTKAAKEYKLCEKLLGLENTPSACFAYRLDRCKGACTAQELPIAYNMRFITAFSKLKVKPWPFNGSIMIEEKHDWSGKSEYFLVNEWCYLGSMTYDEDGVGKKTMSKSIEFDVDIYKILLRFMQSPKNLHRIKTLSPEQITAIESEITGSQVASF
jgi:DNA polymerase-3 subunit epsilon